MLPFTGGQTMLKQYCAENNLKHSSEFNLNPLIPVQLILALEQLEKVMQCIWKSIPSVNVFVYILICWTGATHFTLTNSRKDPTQNSEFNFPVQLPYKAEKTYLSIVFPMENWTTLQPESEVSQEYQKAISFGSNTVSFCRLKWNKMQILLLWHVSTLKNKS